MPKLCSCFKGNSDDRKQNKKPNTIKKNKKKNFGLSLFLLGDDESGKTKIIEELVDEDDPFTREDKILKISEIERYIRDSLTDILRAFKQSDPSVQFDYPENYRRMTYILTTAHETDFEYPVEFFEYVETLWVDTALQEFLELPNTYKLPESAKYFLNRIPQIRDPDYIPTTEDMIYARLFPSQIFNKSFEIESKGMGLNVLEMNSFNEELQESIQSFRNKTNMIIFITDCSGFDEVIDDQQSKTRLHQSIDLYKMVRNNKSLEGIPVVLLFNKQDLLAKKIQNGVQLEFYFPEFEDHVFSNVNNHNVDSNEDPEVIRAKHFIAKKFLSINSNNCIHHLTCDQDLTLRLIFDNYRALHQ